MRRKLEDQGAEATEKARQCIINLAKNYKTSDELYQIMERDDYWSDEEAKCPQPEKEEGVEVRRAAREVPFLITRL